MIDRASSRLVHFLDAWRGELFGEAIMRIGLEKWPDGNAHRDAIEQVRRIEALVGGLLFDALKFDANLADERSAAETRARRALEAYQTWQEMVSASKGPLRAALPRFVELRRTSCGVEAIAADLLIAHEAALIEFMDTDALAVPLPEENALTRYEHGIKVPGATARRVDDLDG